ncbi:MAG TPA: type II toxin-antitoxin system antitoxin SocA domain-containing protein [Tepidisphaeraceae bacterium]|nr:type II toxin-antitoxin system antitoxin SocA domain-containing protein [Tepidisphaeraceae bacterium]
MSVTQSLVLTRLIPFNPHRFDACMSFLAQKIYDRPLTTFELVKLHVMTDVFHVLRTGHQAIGGELCAWTYGPVVEPAYHRLKEWEHRHEESGLQFQPTGYQIVDGEVTGFSPNVPFDPEDLAPSELDAMAQASDLLRPMSFDQAFWFFHSDQTFMGRAYNHARRESRALAWDDIIDAHDALRGSNLQHLKQRLISYG